MAIEARNGRRYYYRKRRIGRGVVSEYVASGPLVRLAGDVIAGGSMGGSTIDGPA